jgi:peptidase E
MQLKDLSTELDAKAMTAVEGGNVNDFLQSANTSSLLADMQKQIQSAVLNNAVINNTGGNFAFSADVTSNDSIDQYSDVDQRNRQGRGR